MWARSPSSWCRCRSSGTYSSCSKRKTLRPAQRLERRTRKNSRYMDLKRNGKQEINRRWKLRNEPGLSCFHRCLLHRFSQDLLNHFLRGLFNLLLWLPYAEMEWDTVTASAIVVLYEWFWFLASHCGKPCKHVGQNLRPCSTSRCFWRALNRLATRAMHKMDQSIYRSSGAWCQNLKCLYLTLPPFIFIQTFPTKIPWPPLNLSTSRVGKHSFVCTQRWCQQR